MNPDGPKMLVGGRSKNRFALPRIGIRREALLFLPITALVLLALSVFSLFSYRRTIELLTTERREQATAIAERLATNLAGRSAREVELGDSLGLASFGLARGAALIDVDGFGSATAGLMAEGNLLGPLAGQWPKSPHAVGPNRDTGPVVAAFVPVALRDREGLVRVDLAATALAGQTRALTLLTWLVLGIGIALFALLLQYLRHLLSPIDALLARARRIEHDESDLDEDEAAFLIRSFDRALDSMVRADSEADGEEADLARLEKSLGSVESGLLLLDREGQVLALNEVGAETLGIAEPPEPRPATEILAAHPELLAVLLGCVERGEGAQRAECTLERKGQPLPLGLSVHPLRRDDGSVRGWLSLFADLTVPRQLDRERQLSESLDRVGELTAGLAHELRNSLASLRGYLTLIERGGEREELSDYLVEVRHEADHLYRVLQDFLSFARPGSARMESVDLERLAHRAASDPALEGAPIRVAVDGGNPLPEVPGDPQLLERALRNLLHNAIRAHADAGKAQIAVEVHLEADESTARVRILDQGPGIADELRKGLFVPFASGRPDGTGLGLALALRIAELHLGRLTLESRNLGGTEAVLELPAGQYVTEGSESSSMDAAKTRTSSSRPT